MPDSKESSTRAGDGAPGAIEIIHEPDAVREVVEARRRNASDKGLPGSGDVGVVFEDEYILVVRDAVRFPSGATGTYLRVFERSGLDGPSGVVAVAVRSGELYLRRVFRHATRSWELECPRGFRTPGESGEAAVRRELAEELGIGITSLRRMGEVLPNSGLLASTVETWFVTLDAGDPDSRPEAHEAFGEIVRVPAPRVGELVASGELRDGISLSAISQAEAQGLLRASPANTNSAKSVE